MQLRPISITTNDTYQTDAMIYQKLNISLHSRAVRSPDIDEFGHHHCPRPAAPDETPGSIQNFRYTLLARLSETSAPDRRGRFGCDC